MSELSKEIIIATIEDSVSSFLYYDRKEDEDFSVECIKDKSWLQFITIEEVIETFKKELLKGIEG